MVFMRTRSRDLLLLVLMSSILAIPLHARAHTPPPSEPNGDVPMFRGDAGRSGAMPGPGLTGKPSLLWWLEMSSPSTSTPAVVNGVAYLGDGFFGSGVLRAVDTATGQELWVAELPGQPFGSSPAVGDAMAFIGDMGGNVTGIDVASGEVAWSTSVGGDVTSSPAVADGMVYIRNGEDVLFALDAVTGEERWRFPTGGTGGYTLDTAPAVVDGVVYMTTIGSDLEASLFAIDAETGEQLWSFSPGSPGLNTPAVVDGVVYAGGDGGIYAVDAASGDQIWNAPIGEGISAPAVGEGLVVMHTRNDLVAVDASSGEERWRFETRGSWSAPTLVDGIVYVGSQGMGRIGLYLVDAATGQVLWHVRAMGSMNSSPVVAGGVVYAVGNDGLFAFGSSQIEAAPGQETTITTMIGRLTFATELDESGVPLDPSPRLASGATRLVVSFDHVGIPQSATYHIVWLLDGEPIYENEEEWALPENGNATSLISTDSGSLPDGVYEVVMSVDGDEMQRGTVTIGDE
jgi:outer membrane protein assembly factor BamB